MFIAPDGCIRHGTANGELANEKDRHLRHRAAFRLFESRAAAQRLSALAFPIALAGAIVRKFP